MEKLKPFVWVLGLLAAFSCAKQDPKGVVQLSLDIEPSFATAPACENFDITVSDGTEILWKGRFGDWDNSPTAKDMPVSEKLKVEAVWGNPAQEGFDKAFFRGSADFAFKWENTTVGVPVKLANSAVKTVCSEMFGLYFTSCDFEISTKAGNHIHVTGNEERPVFINSAPFTVSATLTAFDGSVHLIEPKEYAAPAPAECVTLNFDLCGIGGASIEIIFDDTVETIDLGEIPVSCGLLSLRGLEVSCDEPDTKADGGIDGYYVIIADSRGQEIRTMTYAQTREQEGSIALPVGDYTLIVRSTEQPAPAAAFDCPVSGCAEPFKIKAEELTVIEKPLVCRPLQTKVTVSFDDDFLSAISADSAVRCTLSNGASLEYPVSYNDGSPVADSRAAYFLVDAADLDLSVCFDGFLYGQGFRSTEVINNVKAASWHKVSFGLKVQDR